MPPILAVFVIFFGFFQELWDMLRQPQFRSIFLWAIITIIAGTIFYNRVEGWSLLDSLYFCVVTLATVGYGDFSPDTQAGKIFTIVYILFGLSLLATFVHTLAKERQLIYERRIEERRKKAKK